MELTNTALKNILIHEFHKGNKPNINYPEYIAYTFKYHKDWNWLMEVVEKIETLKYIDEFNIQYDSVAKGHIVSITPAYNNTFNAIYTEVYENKIDAVYHAVIKFIEWYNQQK